MKLAVIGLGYVGLPLAIELAKKYETVYGFDLNEGKVEAYKNGIDVTSEVGTEALLQTTMQFTSNLEDIKEANFYIVAVPTPINSDKTPDLTPIVGASELIGKILSKGDIVVYESTVYPGTTEEVCIPILEKQSGLTFGEQFKVGYSPERINPGDKVNTLTKIVKIVSGSDAEALETISSVYGSIIEAGLYKAESIKVAEAAKVIENSQRDINIAFMNELSIVFDKMGIDTYEVLKAAGTKWNFLNFTPGLVGGHCIGVDPYYFTYKAEQLGYHSQIILAGRKINDEMGEFVANKVIKQMNIAGILVKGSKVAVLGATFKENCPDVRNSKVFDIIHELEEIGVEIMIYDPMVDQDDLKRLYNREVVSREELENLDAVIVAVAHETFKKEISSEDLENMFKQNQEKLLFDLKHMYSNIDKSKFSYWGL